MAAIAVVFNHSSLAAHAFLDEMPDYCFKLFNLGYLGVDYFFVLSGFIIAHSTRVLKPNAEGAKKYFYSRCVRIYVPYIPISLLMMAVLTWMPSVSSGVHDNFSWVASLFLLPSTSEPALLLAWTLQHEVVFYFIFGICFFWLKNLRLIFLWTIPICFFLISHLAPWENVIVGIINLEFLLGIIACYLYHDTRLFAFRHLLLGFGILLLATSGVLLFNDQTISEYRLLAGLGFTFIVLSLVYIESHFDFSRFSTLIFLGSASYAIYLIHIPLISVLSRTTTFVPHWFLGFVIFVVFSCLAGVAYFQMIEKPLISFVKKHLP